jgi:hypothetical protein
MARILPRADALRGTKPDARVSGFACRLTLTYGSLSGRHQPAGRFIWQLVGVLETYGSICFTGTKV